jgi:hypothetical protein
MENDLTRLLMIHFDLCRGANLERPQIINFVLLIACRRGFVGNPSPPKCSKTLKHIG